MFGNLGTIWAEMGLDTTKLNMGVAKAKASMASMGSSSGALVSSLKSAAVGVGLVGGVIAAASVKMAADFDTSIRKAGSVAEATDAQMKTWGKSVLDMSKKFPQSATEIADALYWIKSDMPDATDAQQFATLEIAAKGAVGGIAELEDATEALITVQNAYNDQNPAKYMDLMTWAVQRGSITLQDFVANMGKATGTAAMTDVPFQELAAAAATLTRKGVPADTAFMALNQTMMAFLKNTDEAGEIAQKYGIDMSLAGLKSKGLAGSLMEISQKVPDDELARLFPNIRALRAVFPLAGTAAAEFARDLSLAGEATGTTDKMAEINMASLENRFKVMVNNIKKPMIELGTKLFPILEKAMNAVVRIFDGKNQAFNVFANALKMAGKAAYGLADALLKIWPVLLLIAGGFAAMKITNFVTSIASAATKLPLLNTVLDNLRLGLGGVMPIGGLATSLGTVALLAAPAAISVGLFIKNTIDMNREAEAAAKTLLKMREAHKETALATLPLVQKLDDVRKKQAEAAEGSQEYINATQEVRDVQNQIAANFPSLAQGWDEERNAILGNTREMKANLMTRIGLAGYSVTSGEPTEFQNVEAMVQKMDKTQTRFDTMNAQVTELASLFDAAGLSGSDVFDAWYTSAEAGTQVTTAMMHELQQTGQMSIQEWQRISPLMDMLNREATIWGGTLGSLNTTLQQLGPEWAAGVQAMAQQAMSAGQQLQGMPNYILLAYRSAKPEMQEAGVSAFAAYLTGMMQNQGMAAGNAGAIAQQPFNEGTFVATGNAAVDAALASMAQKVQMSNLGKGAAAALKQSFSGMDNLFGGKKEQKITLKVSDGGTGKSLNGSLKQVQDSANKLNNTKPVVNARGNTAKANATIARLQNRLAAIDGKTLATVSVKAVIRGSGPFTADEYVKYLENKIGGASPQLTVNAKLGKGAVFGMEKEWAALQSNALVGWSGSRMAPNESSMGIDDWNRINEAIADLAPGNAAALKAWWDMNGALTAAKAAMEKYATQIDASEARLTKLRITQDALNKSLQAHQDKLNAYASMKIIGETAAADKSLSLQHQINGLELARLKALDQKKYKEAAAYAGQKKQVEKQKELLDLQTTYNYEMQQAAIDRTLNPVTEHSSGYIISGIKTEQNAISQTKAAIAKVESQISAEEATVNRLKAAQDGATASVTAYQARVDQMAQNFRDHYQEMINKVQELARAQEQAAQQGGGAPHYASGGPVTSTGLIYAHAGEYVLSRDMLRAMRGKGSTTKTSNSVSNFFFNKLELVGVQDPDGLKKQLMDARLRMAVPG
jgi:TP901 family phage tail tape measure protein